MIDESEVVGGKSMEKISVLLISVPLMIAAIVCTLFADRIDTAVKGDKKVRKVIVVFSVGVFFICAFAIAVSILA
nr:protein CrcB-like protein [uncultured Oscillibacter sp.]